MKTLGRNADNDLYLEAGQIAELHDADAQCAIIESIILTQQGELQFDDDAGIDYFGTVLQNPKTIEFWAGQVTSKIEALDFVASVEDFTYEFKREESTLLWSMTVVNTDNERLDLRNKKTVLDGTPGIGIKWGDIYDKPAGADENISTVEAMSTEAKIQGTLNARSTLADVKNLINKVVYTPSDPEYARSKLITFSLSGVPVGAQIDFSNLKIINRGIGPSGDTYLPVTLAISDGFTETYTIGAEGVIDLIHTFTKRGTITITLQGEIAGLVSVDPNLPILVGRKVIEGQNETIQVPFGYVTGFSVGERVPLAIIGDGAFRSLKNLQVIDWKSEEDVSQTIGDYAFADCSSISNLQWLSNLKGLTSLGTGCFSGCSNLVGLSTDTTSFTLGVLTAIPAECFKDCIRLRVIYPLPETITEIGESAFEGCVALSSIDYLPAGMTTLGNSCFKGCTSVTSLVYPPEALETIGDSCFEGCIGLTCVYLPKNLSSIGERAFHNCPKLTHILSEAISNGNPPSITEDSFDSGISVCVSAENLEAYNDHWGNEHFEITKYGVYSFELEGITAGFSINGGMSRLASDSVWAISFTGEDGAYQRFANTESMLPSYSFDTTPTDGKTTVVIKGYIREIAGRNNEKFPFLSNRYGIATESTTFPYLKSIVIKDSPLELIGDCAFKGCINLESIDLGFEQNHPYRLGTSSFYNCQSLENLEWLTSGLGSLQDESGNYLPAFGEMCFMKCSGLKRLGYSVDYVTSLPISCFYRSGLISLDGLGANLESIGNGCFYLCENLTDISALKETMVTQLSSSCFKGCTSLTSIDGIQNIDSRRTEGTNTGISAFEGCSALTDISAIGEAQNFTSIPNRMFFNCTSLQSIDSLGVNIDYFGEHAFYGCSRLTDIQMFSATPPVLANNYVFTGTSVSNGKLFVRQPSLQQYSFDSSWNSVFSSILSRTISFGITVTADETISLIKGEVSSTSYWLIDWGDGAVEFLPPQEGDSEETIVHTYAATGNYTIRLEGAIDSIAGILEGEEFLALPSTRASRGTPTTLEEFATAMGITPTDTTTPNVIMTTLGLPETADIQEAVEVYYGEAPRGQSFISPPAAVVSLSQTDASVLSKIGDCTFINNSSLVSVNMPNATEIGKAAFAFASGLHTAQLDILANVTSIGNYAFYGCTGLEAITNIGTGGQSVVIGDFAFAALNENAPSYIQVNAVSPEDAVIAEHTFGNINKATTTVYVPAGTVQDFKAQTSTWKDFKVMSRSIRFVMGRVDDGTTIQGGIGIVNSNSQWEIAWGDNSTPTARGANETGIPEHIYTREEGDSAWIWDATTGSYYLSNVVVQISGDITGISCNTSVGYPILSLGNNENPHLTRVEGGESLRNLRTIGDGTFKNCSALRTAKGFSTVSSLGSEAFANCTSLEDLGSLTGGNGLLELSIVSGGAFKNCTSLRVLDAFPHASQIGDSAFEGCVNLQSTSGLGKDYEGTDNPEGIGARFGEKAFFGCAFSVVDMRNFFVPPTISLTTFGYEIGEYPYLLTRDYGETNPYATAAVWENFQITTPKTEMKIVIPANVLIGGVIFDGDNCRITQHYGEETPILVDWGDGATTLTSGSIGKHYYDTDSVASGLTITVRGNISRIGLIDAAQPIFCFRGSDTTTLTLYDYIEYGNGTRAWYYRQEESTVRWNSNQGKFIREKSEPTYPENLNPTYSELPEGQLEPIVGEDSTLITDVPIAEVSWDDFNVLEEIEDRSFAGTKIERLIVRSNVLEAEESLPLTIGTEAFHNCTSLVSINLKNGLVRTIGTKAFAGCTSLEGSIVLGPDLELIGIQAFKDTSISSVTITGPTPDGKEVNMLFQTECFSGCRSLTIVAISNYKFQSIGTSAFAGCSALSNESANSILGALKKYTTATPEPVEPEEPIED